MLRSCLRLSRTSGVRGFSSSVGLMNKAPTTFRTAKNLSEVVDKHDLIGPGSTDPKKIPTDLEQATGLERFELLGQLEGVEVFDSLPLDASRTGTMADPIIIDSYDDYRYVGCTGAPLDSHIVQWLKPTTDKVARCWECGSVYKLNFIGDPHAGHH